MKWNCFLNFLFSSFLLVCRIQAIFVYLFLTLTLQHSLMNSSSFLVASLRFPMYSVMSSADSDPFTSFQLWIPFISSSGLIAMTKTSKIMLNKSDK